MAFRLPKCPGLAKDVGSRAARRYLRAFFNARVGDPSAITAAEFDGYVRTYAASGAMGAGNT
jgi:hypothetical protein